MVLIAILTGVSLVFGLAICVILLRRKLSCCSYDKDGDKVSGTSTDSSALANNVILKVNNMNQMSQDSLKMAGVRVTTPSGLSNEVDSVSGTGHSCWDAEDFRNNTGNTQLFRHNSDLEPDFPPKPVSFKRF